MVEQDNGGPAFPGERYSETGWKVGVGRGMTLRDYAACAALPAVMARMHEDIQSLGSPTFPSNVAIHAYRIADAMLAERNRATAQTKENET